MFRAVAIGLLAAVAGAVPAGAAVKPAQDAPLGHEGRWVTDRKGRVVVLHGFNMVYKRPPYHPIHAGFGKDDARFLARHGFNTIRLGVIYAGVEPEPGSYDDAYLAKIAKTQRMLAKHGIYSMLDWHQDMYNERFEGEGWPDWAVMDDGMPAEPKNGFPANYLTMPALNRAYDHFWANDPGPGDVGLVDRYAAAWKHFAGRFRTMPGSLGLRPDERAVARQRLPELRQHRGLSRVRLGPAHRLHAQDDRRDSRGRQAEPRVVRATAHVRLRRRHVARRPRGSACGLQLPRLLPAGRRRGRDGRGLRDLRGAAVRQCRYAL